MAKIGTYTIICESKKKVYVGRTHRLNKMYEFNFNSLADGTHWSDKLQTDYDEMDGNALKFSIALEMSSDTTEDELHAEYDKLIAQYRMKGYDLSYTYIESEEEIGIKKKRNKDYLDWKDKVKTTKKKRKYNKTKK